MSQHREAREAVIRNNFMTKALTQRQLSKQLHTSEITIRRRYHDMKNEEQPIQVLDIQKDKRHGNNYASQQERDILLDIVAKEEIGTYEIDDRLQLRGVTRSHSWIKTNLDILGYHRVKRRPQGHPLNQEENEKRLEFGMMHVNTSLEDWLVCEDEFGIQIGGDNVGVWVKKGQQAYGNYDRATRINVAIAVSRTGLVHYEILPKDAYYNTQRFRNCVAVLCRKLRTSDHQNIRVWADGAAWHKSESVYEEFEDAGIDYEILPPSTPQFNPAEIVIGEIKRAVRKGRCTTRDKLERKLIEVLTSFETKDFNNLFDKLNTTIQEHNARRGCVNQFSLEHQQPPPRKENKRKR